MPYKADPQLQSALDLASLFMDQVDSMGGFGVIAVIHQFSTELTAPLSSGVDLDCVPDIMHLAAKRMGAGDVQMIRVCASGTRQ